MQITFVSDIFGKTSFLEKLKDQVCDNSQIIDPYSGYKHDFRNEDEAYRYFQEEIGLEKYSHIVYKNLESISGSALFIGFSVGASAIWVNSQHKYKGKISAIGFYSSQIRNHISVNPTFDIELIFPCAEKAFSVKSLKDKLEVKERVGIKVTEFHHGFMNRSSENFSTIGYEQYTKHLTQRVNHPLCQHSCRLS